MINWYQICVDSGELSTGLTINFHYQIEKENICISPNVRLAGHVKEARIESISLAQQYLDRCLPIFQRRYGNKVELSIMECRTSCSNKRTIKRIQDDSTLIKARLEQNIMASNKKPILTN
jgi:seryl-tRNA(Sec) selenium transferase